MAVTSKLQINLEALQSPPKFMNDDCLKVVYFRIRPQLEKQLSDFSILNALSSGNELENNPGFVGKIIA